MIKKLKPVIIVLIHILFLQGICAQTPMNMSDYLSKKFLNYTTSVPREEIFVHSDREEYLSGEDMWFKVYLIDRQSLKPSAASKIAYFELLNPENRPIVQKRLWLDEGFGPGHISLPDTLTTGTYTMRVYTSWMKNFLPSNCFSKNVQIYNAFSTKIFKGKNNTEGINLGSLNNRVSTLYANTGLKLTVDNLKPDLIDIILSADEKYRSENSNLAYLFIQTHGIIDLVSSEHISDENTKISIPRKQLKAGINQITVFNLKGQPVAERCIFTPEITTPSLVINSVDSTGLRKKISLELVLGSTLTTIPHTSNLSISVAPKTDYPSTVDLNDYLLLGTEFGFNRNSLIKYKKVSEIPPEAMDSLLQNVKSNWIVWDDILADKLPVFKYHMEKTDHYLSGKLIAADRKTGDADRFVLLSVPGKTPVFQYARTDGNGNFDFKIHIDEKIHDLIVQPDVLANNQSVNIETPFSDQYSKPESTVKTKVQPIPDYIPSWSVNLQVRKIYGSSSVGDSITPSVSVPLIKRFYGKPDIELIMKDYIALPVMEEVFFELLPGVALKNRKSSYEISVIDPDFSKPYATQPGLFIDGVAIKEPGLIGNLNPELVEKIDVVREKYFVGDYEFFGLINIITKSGDFSNITLPDNIIRIPYRVIDPVNSFISPDYSTSEIKRNRIPDFRNTLYWNPALKPDKAGKVKVDFWSGDFVSDFEVNIQGMSNDGKPISIKKIIHVKK